MLAFFVLPLLLSVSFSQTVRNVAPGYGFQYCNTNGCNNNCNNNRCLTNTTHGSFYDALMCARTDLNNGISVVIDIAGGTYTEYCVQASCCANSFGGGCTSPCFCATPQCTTVVNGTCQGVTYNGPTGYSFNSVSSPQLTITSDTGAILDFSACNPLAPMVVSTGTTANIVIQGVTFQNYKSPCISRTQANCANFGGGNTCAYSTATQTCRLSNTNAGNGGIIGQSGGALTLTNVNAINNAATQGGFAYASAGTSVSVSGGSFTNNIAQSVGGAFYFDGPATAPSSVLITSATFTGNTACRLGTCYGGALYLNTNVQLNVDTSNFGSNSAGIGGAIYVGKDAGNLVYLTSTVGVSGITNFMSNNAVFGAGGAIWFYGEILSINRCNFTGNNATTTGGAINVQDILLFGSNPVGVASSFFISNYANGDNTQKGGGAIYTSRKITMSQTSLTGNSVGNGNGGGLYILQGNVGLYTCIFSNNNAANGGAVFSSSGGSVEDILSSKQSFFTRNTATTHGGAIYIAAQTWKFDTTSFSQNSATQNGGAIYSGSLQGTVDQGSAFIGNTAAAGGAIYTAGNLDIDGSAGQTSFVGNTATGNGGAVDCVSSPATNIDYILTVTSSAFSKNSAARGGGVYSTCTTVMDSSTFDQNAATATGAAFACDTVGKATGTPCAITVTGCTFNNGSAPANGAGSFAADGNYQISSSTFSLGSNLIIPATQTGLGITTKIVGCSFLTGSNVSANAATTITGNSIFDASSVHAVGSLTVTLTTFQNGAVCDCQTGCTASLSQGTKFVTSTLTNTGTSTVKGVDFSSSSFLVNTATGTVTTDSSTNFAASTISNDNSAVLQGTATNSIVNTAASSTTTLQGFSFTSSTINNLGTVNVQPLQQCIALDSTSFVNKGIVNLAQDCKLDSRAASTSSFINNGQLFLKGIHSWVPDFTGSNTSKISVAVDSATSYHTIKFQDSPNFGGCNIEVTVNQASPLVPISQKWKIITWTTGSALTTSQQPKITFQPPSVETANKLKVAYNPNDITIYSAGGKVAALLVLMVVALFFAL